MNNPPIILKDDPVAFKALIKRAHQQKKKQTRAQKHGRALGRGIRITDKGKRFLAACRESGDLS